ncbi:mechanosensitive ion channel family protein [Roseicella frigidaeris]|uniref:Small-conductance mechanosensitive channel n=1 Tax=Roseicella frigidaeris TaxID=2230885 RepID=A0A327M6J3_9PROT|nr:mechanosensitive ion channel family protein [Roseicella frigidaeris]RAI58359.1 small-conductance mechanosensitive channel [Roseicella frigidaeris]
MGGRPTGPALARPWIVALALLLLGLLVPAAPGRAQTTGDLAAGQAAAPTALAPEEARRAAELLRDPARLREVLTALDALARLAPSPAVPAAPASPSAAPAADAPAPAAPATNAPAAPAATAPSASAPAAGAPAAGAAPATAAPAPPEHVSLTSDSVLGQLIQASSTWLRNAAGQLTATGRTLADLPLVWSAILHTVRSPAAQAAALDAGWKLAVVLLLSWAAQWLVRRALRQPQRMVVEAARRGAERRRARAAAAPHAEGEAIVSHGELRFLNRLPLALLRLLLELVPIGVFAAVGNLLLATPVDAGWAPRLIILTAVNAYVVQHVVMAVGRALVSPDQPLLRLFNVTDETAAYVEVWLARLSRVAVYGMAVLEIARILGLFPSAYQSLAKLVILANHLLLIVVILQSRKRVAAWIAAPAGSHTAFAGVRNWLAATWHILAIILLLAVWFVWALEIRNGYSLLFRYFGVTLVVLAIARLAIIAILGMLDRIFRLRPEQTAQLPFLEARANRYYPLLRRSVSLLLGVIAALAVLQVWGVDAFAWFQDGRLGERLAQTLLLIAIAIVIAVVIWEASIAWMDHQINGMVAEGDYARATRLRTLLPLLRTALLTAIVIVVGFTALSQLGVNIAPLLAGASIIGVALGFGSQKLVQDIINGIFLLLENTMQVGDWVTVSGLSGSVEALSVRTIRLRAGDGSVHVIPFSAVTTVTNTNRGIGNAAVSVTVAFDEDTDRVGEVLKEIGAALREDPAFRHNILDDFALWGVDQVDGATATVLGQIKCTDSGRWGVQREFNRRIKRRFQELGIEIAVPTRSIILSRPHRPEPAPQRPPGAASPASGAEPRSPPPAALGNTA